MIHLLRLGPFRNAYLVRGALVWLVVRLAAGLANLATLNTLQGIWVLVVVAVGVWLDARRRGEDIFLGNLGIPGWAIGICALPAAALLEVVVP